MFRFQQRRNEYTIIAVVIIVAPVKIHAITVSITLLLPDHIVISVENMELETEKEWLLSAEAAEAKKEFMTNAPRQ